MQPTAQPIRALPSSNVDSAHEAVSPEDEAHGHHVERTDLVRIGLVAVAVAVSWLIPWQPFLAINMVALAATLAGGYPIYREAFEALRERRMTMELSMTIALVAALSIREAFTAVVIVLFVLIAEVLEHMTVGRGRRAIKDLLDLLPRTVAVRRIEGVSSLSASDLAIGDIVVIRPGGRVPVDGLVESGHSFVDQAAITGESLPVEKVPGASVFAGTINQSGTLDVRATGIGPDTTFAKIVQVVEHAQESRAPIQKTADRLSGYLVYFALGAAVLTFLLTRDARSTISVIIVAGACGIAAGTPLAILGAVGRAARLGAIVKGGIYIEMLGQVDTIVLDKTGTLTLGDPRIVALHPAPGSTMAQLLEAAAIAELPSEHPLAKAVLVMAKDEGIQPREPDHFTYVPGKGIVCSLDNEAIVVGSRALLEGEGVTLREVDAAATVLVARAGRFLGALELADVLRPEAIAAIAAIRRMGMRTVLLTGDSTSIAKEVGALLRVDEVHAELLPEQKLKKVRDLQGAGKRVAMVGDGINDAPALAQADVGIAMGSGTDVARESADVLLLGNDLLKLVETLRIARQCRRIIWQNFAGTLAVDGLGILLAAFRFLNPLLAALIHVSSELLFIMNSTRLLPSRRGRDVGGRTLRAGRSGEAA
jgi:heavy metal translocating P-type ATPase